MNFRDRDIWILAGLWLAFSVAAEWIVALALDQWPIVIAEQGRITADAFAFLLRVGVVIFVLVALLIVYSAIRFRAPREEATDAPVESFVQRRGNRAFTLGWVGITTALNLLFIVYPGAVGLGDLWRLEREAEARGPIVVEVTGRQWGWSYNYPAYGIEGATELALPVDRPAKLLLSSGDVIHGFWVPAFGIKKDVIPGQTVVLYITPTTIASTEGDPRVRVQCAELCGIGHAEMRSGVRILSPTDFDAWVADRQAPGATMGPMPGMSMAPGETMAPPTMGPMPGMSMAPGETMAPPTMGPMPGMSMAPGETMAP
ncbi:MAG: cytochrome c oxidase subunit II, partial [Chloroflexota bacterium]